MKEKDANPFRIFQITKKNKEKNKESNLISKCDNDLLSK